MSKQLSTERGALLPDVSGSVGRDAEETLLLAEARTEHPTAFADLVERHADRVRRMALRVTRNLEDAEVPAKCRRVLQSALTPEDSYLRRELEAILAEEIGGLKPRFQRALRLCCADGLTTPDAAKVLGISPPPSHAFDQRKGISGWVMAVRHGTDFGG